jgi:hypothetical protein
VRIGSNLTQEPSAGANGAATVANLLIAAADTAPAGVAAPSAGVVVSWTLRSNGALPGTTASLRVIRGTTGIAIGTAELVPLQGGIFSYPARLAIAAGDLIGIDVNQGGIVAAVGQPGGGSLQAWSPPLAVNETRPPDEATSDVELLLNATVEPDADGDGFGDESQDACPGSSGTIGGCPLASPDTTLSEGPEKREFSFSSPDTTATFECAVDNRGYVPCTSPTKPKKLRPGRHELRVRAVSPAGVVDLTPATLTFRR